MSEYVVVGGGLSGLAAAWRLRELLGDSPAITVLEAAPQLGGKASSRRIDEWLVEEGPSAFLMRGGALDAFVEGLAFQDELVRPASRRRLLFHRGKLREVTANPFAMVMRGLLTAGGAARLCLEPFVRSPAPAEESVFDFTCRRFGVDVATSLVAPMVLGISAGDARKLSVDAVFPEWRGMEQEHGSMVRGVMARPKGAMRMVGLKNGVGSLIEAAAASGRFKVETSTEVAALSPSPTGVTICERDGAIREVAGAIVALPPACAAAVFQGEHALCGLLGELPEPPVLVAAVGFQRDQCGPLPDAFGVLIPRGQGIRSLGIVFESALFDGRAPKGHILLKVMLGGGIDPAIANLTDEALRELVLQELQQVLGWRSEPCFWHVRRWKEAIPQGQLGHQERRGQLEAALRSLPNIELAGTGVWGIGVEKAVSAGFRAAERLAT